MHGFGHALLIPSKAECRLAEGQSFSEFFNAFKRDFTLGVGANHLWIKRKSSGDNIHQGFFRTLGLIGNMCSAKDQTTLVSKNEEMNEFVPFRVIRLVFVLAAAVDDGNISKIPGLSAKTLQRNS